MTVAALASGATISAWVRAATSASSVLAEVEGLLDFGRIHRDRRRDRLGADAHDRQHPGLRAGQAVGVLLHERDQLGVGRIGRTLDAGRIDREGGQIAAFQAIGRLQHRIDARRMQAIGHGREDVGLGDVVAQRGLIAVRRQVSLGQQRLVHLGIELAGDRVEGPLGRGQIAHLLAHDIADQLVGRLDAEPADHFGRRFLQCHFLQDLPINAALHGLVGRQGLARAAFGFLAIVVIADLEVLRRNRPRAGGDHARDARSVEHVADPEHGEADDQQAKQDHREGRFGEGAETGEHDWEDLPDYRARTDPTK